VLELSGSSFQQAAERFVATMGLLPRDFWAITLFAALGHSAIQADLVVHGHGADTLLAGSRWDRRLRLARRLAVVGKLVPSILRTTVARGLPLDTSHLGDLRVLLESTPEELLLMGSTVELDRKLRHRHSELFGRGIPPRAFRDRYWAAGGDPGDNLRRMGMHRALRANLFELTAIADSTAVRWSYPFLEGGVFNLARGLPPARRVRADGITKPLVREAFARYLPREWAHRPKLGFVTPGREMMQGPLASWVSERVGPGTVADVCLGPTVGELTLEADYQLLWTLATVEEYRRVVDLELPGGGTPSS
jgi:hypothetical protein